MVPKRQRLSRREFNNLLKHGRRVHGAHCSLMVTRATPDMTKFGVVVSKKTAKRATARNLLRRRVYAILRAHSPLSAGALAVFTKPSCANLSFHELSKELTELLARV